MRLLAISDDYIPANVIADGFAPLNELLEIEIRHWAQPSLIALQEANLLIEQGGPDAVAAPDDLYAGIERFELLVTQFAPVPAAVIQSGANLRAIAVLRGGIENVDVARATALGIPVLNTPGRNARAVAECTIGLMLAEVRNIARAHERLKNGAWVRSFPNSEQIPELHGKTVGLLGCGAVGRLVAGYLAAFGCTVIAYDPYFHGDPGPVQITSLQDVLCRADIVSLHARLTPETKHLIGQAELALMKSSAVIVNTARSGLIDEAALVEALAERRIMGAALDVFDQEPLGASHRLLALDNVTLAPHIAGSTADAFRNAPRMLAAHLRNLLQGTGPLPVVNGLSVRF